MPLSFGLFALPLLLMGLGQLLMLLPERLLRGIAGARGPLAIAMLPFALGLTLLGLLLACQQGSDIWHARQTQRWATVSARIESSRLGETMQPRSSQPAWRPDVTYVYRFDNRLHRGHRIAFSPTASGDREGTTRWLQAHYPPGAQVQVFVNPSAPSEAVLEAGGSAWSWWFVGIGLVLAGSGAWLLRSAWRPYPTDLPRNGRKSEKTNPYDQHR